MNGLLKKTDGPARLEPVEAAKSGN